MKNFFEILSIISAIIMVITILLQQRGSSLGRAFGGEGNTYRTKRGAERVIFNATILASVVFVLSTMLGILSK